MFVTFSCTVVQQVREFREQVSSEQAREVKGEKWTGFPDSDSDSVQFERVVACGVGDVGRVRGPLIFGTVRKSDVTAATRKMSTYTQR